MASTNFLQDTLCSEYYNTLAHFPLRARLHACLQHGYGPDVMQKESKEPLLQKCSKTFAGCMDGMRKAFQGFFQLPTHHIMPTELQPSVTCLHSQSQDA